MKKSVLVVLISLFLLITAGCGFFSAETSVAEMEEGSEEAAAPAEPAAKKEQKEPEAAAEDIIKNVVEAKEKGPEEEVNETNVTVEVEMNISGSLDLQEDLLLCPHLAESFSCNKYDVRRCDFETFVGKNGTYPDLISCRDGRKKGENPGNKYCLIQECGPVEEGNIAYAHGGMAAFAEYIYRVEKVEGGIMTHYTLKRCGETYKEFNSSFDCTVYKSELDIW